MYFTKLTALMLLLSCGLVLANCDDNGTDPIICTDEFVTIILKVENSSGEPVENLEMSVTKKQTGEELKVCQSDVINCGNGAGGNYVIFHDGLYEEVSMEGEMFEVHGEKDEISFTEDFVFAKDECHVFKKSGPDTVTVN